MDRLVVTPDMVAWLRDAYPRYSVEAMTRRFNQRFGTAVTPLNLKSHCTRRGIRSGRQRGNAPGAHCPVWTQAMKDWLRAHVTGTPYAELAKMIRREFGVNVTPGAVQQKAQVWRMPNGRTGRMEPGNRPWNTGLKGFQAGGRAFSTQFQPGGSPWTTLPVGSYRQIDHTGCWMLKVADSDPTATTVKGRHGWRYVHHLTWEAAHGRAVPRGWVVVAVDGNPDNCLDADNLVGMPRAGLTIANRRGLKDVTDPAARRVLLTAAHLEATARARGRAAGMGPYELGKLLRASA
jgi:hypothetical protein